MKITTIVILSIAVLLLAACGGSGGSDDQLPDFDDMPAKEPDKRSAKLADLFASGKMIHCTYKMNDQGVDMDVETWNYMDLSRSRTKVVASGVSTDTLSIVTPESVFIVADENNPMMADCDWVEQSSGGSSDIPDFDEDFTMEEAMAAYGGMYADFDCKVVSVDENLFAPDGEICNMEDLAAEMMEGLGSYGLDE